MKIKKRLLWILFLILSAGSIFAEDAAKTEVAAEEKKVDESKFEINALVQARVVTGQANSGYANKVSSYTNAASTHGNDFKAADFDFRRLRLTTKYQATSWVGGVLDIKAENLIKTATPSSTGTLNTSVTVPTALPASATTTAINAITQLGAIQEANIWLKPGFLGTTVKVGQFKLPFTRESFSSSANLIVNELSFGTKVVQENDIGLFVSIQPLEVIGKDWSKKLDLIFTLTNGNGGGDVGVGNKFGEFTGLAPLKSTSKLYNWRVQINPFGGIVKDGKESDWKDGEEIFGSESILWSIAAAGAYSTGYEGQSGVTGLFTSGQGFTAHTFDTTFSAFGIYVNGAYTIANPNTLSKSAIGYTSYEGTLGYNIKIGAASLMPVVRYDYQQYDVNGDNKIGSSEKLSSIWIGANLFAIKHNLKLQIFYNILNDANYALGKTNLHPLGKDVFYFQLQTSIGKKV